MLVGANLVRDGHNCHARPDRYSIADEDRRAMIRGQSAPGTDKRPAADCDIRPSKGSAAAHMRAESDLQTAGSQYSSTHPTEAVRRKEQCGDRMSKREPPSTKFEDHVPHNDNETVVER